MSRGFPQSRLRVVLPRKLHETCIRFPATCSGAASNSYPQGENFFAAPIMRSTSKLVNNFPCNQARQLSGSFLGRCPSPIIDFIRLNASSICHRHRYSCRIVFRVHDRGSVVHRKKYPAASRDSSDTAFCFLLASCFSFFPPSSSPPFSPPTSIT